MPDEPVDDRKGANAAPSRGTRATRFLAGGLFVHEFSLPAGRLMFAATVLIRGTNVELWDADD